jgi:hypothetical protein
MANRRFIDFPIAASVGDNDIVLIWQDGMNKQTTKGTLIQGAPTSLEGLTDVDIAGLINGQILQYNSTTGKWENVDRTDINLSELGDVSIVSPTNGQVLVYNSSTSKWENSSGGYVPYTGAVTTVDLGAQSILAGSFVKAGGTSSQFLKADGSVDSTAYGTGSVTSVGLTMPTAFSVANSPVTTAGTLAVTATGTTAQYIRGDGSLATFPALTGFVPYTGATADVNLGTHDLAAERGTFANNGSSDTLTVNHTSGSGYGIIVTKGGNNEALYVSKTSGSGNAMTVIGGRTSLVDLALSSVTNTAGDFLTISGGVVHKRTAAQTLTDIGGQAALTNPVTGTGTTNYLPKFTGSTTIGNSQVFDNGTNVGIGTATPANLLQIIGNDPSQVSIEASSGNTNSQINLKPTGTGIAYIKNQANTAFAFGTNNTEQLRITSGGNLLVGTTTDAGFKLDVNGTGRFSGKTIVTSSIAGDAIMEVSNTNTTNGFGLNVRGGVGSTSYALNVVNAADTIALFTVMGSGAATFSSSVTATEGIINGTSTYLLSLNNTAQDVRMQLQVNGTQTFQLSSSTSQVNLFGATNIPIILYTNATERMRITSGGNVGIGTSSPDGKLKVVGSSGAQIIIDYIGNNENYYDADTHYFRSYGGGGYPIRMAITSSGNVLIGTTTDAGDKLQVNGAIKTSAPSGGTAGSWKFGTATSGIFTIGGKIRIEINGVAYDILTT